MSHTVLLKGEPVWYEGSVATGATINPGMVVEESSADTYQPHSTAGAFARKLFAFERAQIGNGIDEDIGEDEQFQIMACKSGMKVLSWLADGQNVSIGAALESDGAGGLQAQGTGSAPNDVIAYAREALNNTSGSQSRIEVEVA